MDRENEHLAGRAVAANATRGLQPIHARHGDVHHHHVGAQGNGLRQSLDAVTGLAHDLDVGFLLQQRLETNADNHVIVHQQYAYLAHTGWHFLVRFMRRP